MSEWIDVEKKLPNGPGDIVMVKLKDGIERKCYYHQDRMNWIYFYLKEGTSYFQDLENYKFLHNVTHWMPIKINTVT